MSVLRDAMRPNGLENLSSDADADDERRVAERIAARNGMALIGDLAILLFRYLTSRAQVK